MAFLRLFSILAILAMVNASEYDDSTCYSHTCPKVEKISKKITEKFIKDDPTLAPGLLRILFHDCIVRGCDASVLIDPTPSNNATEKDTVPNSTLRGFQVVDAIKAELEQECPGVVSCADVLSLAARDAIVAINGPWWNVPLGRKDGKISLASEALANIPSPFSNITVLKQNFAAVGLTPKDLVVLSAAHTIGIGHCFLIQRRLYNFTGKGDTDPSIDPSYAAELKEKCPKVVGDFKTFVPMDFITPTTFDENYFGIVAKNKGLFQSDAALLNDETTKNYIYTQIYTQGASFIGKDFAESMEKLIQIGILTGDQGEVRKICGAVNGY
ncbi:peroxidase 1-like [Silene latifolia]|uniref:peroxidase 1-like n=1 Tax=Silene latifolia TaxID=37657 RepID=UPI003D77DC5D